jgi:hypothetical protein
MANQGAFVNLNRVFCRRAVQKENAFNDEAQWTENAKSGFLSPVRLTFLRVCIWKIPAAREVEARAKEKPLTDSMA